MKFAIRRIEPFAMIGESGVISNRQQAVEVLRSNSYYFTTVGVIGMIAVAIMWFIPSNVNRLIPYVLAVSIISVGCGILIGTRQSRIASFLMLINNSIVVVSRIIYGDIGGLFFCSVILLMASIRCVSASVKCHKLAESYVSRAT